jgi:hypothetical protein
MYKNVSTPSLLTLNIVLYSSVHFLIAPSWILARHNEIVFFVEEELDDHALQSSSKLLFFPRFLFSTFWSFFIKKYVFSLMPFGIEELLADGLCKVLRCRESVLANLFGLSFLTQTSHLWSWKEYSLSPNTVCQVL